MPPEPDPRDLFDQTILPDLPDTAPDILAALREMYRAGYLRALQQTAAAYSMYDYEPKDSQ